ncbi:MAG: hypothetical protein EA385_03820 [Salinarimonadaceae bacterium]|nr:MAG: hypothetical protein EA385_03820 [Salinarimonadaceae bacterium]
MIGAATAALILAGCIAPAREAPASAAATSGPIFGTQSACGVQIEAFAQLLRRDLANGMVAQRVHDAAMEDLTAVNRACAAGAEAQAFSALRATKNRYGYPS